MLLHEEKIITISFNPEEIRALKNILEEVDKRDILPESEDTYDRLRFMVTEYIRKG